MGVLVRFPVLLLLRDRILSEVCEFSNHIRALTQHPTCRRHGSPFLNCCLHGWGGVGAGLEEFRFLLHVVASPKR